MTDQRKTIATGFQVEQPFVFLLWGTPLSQVRDMLSAYVASFRDSIVDATGIALNGFECSMLLHGDRAYGQSTMRERLTMISFWKQGEFRAIFDEIQAHLETAFGPPHERIPGSDDWPAEYKWVLDDVIVGHYTDGKGGPQQRASIRKRY